MCHPGGQRVENQRVFCFLGCCSLIDKAMSHVPAADKKRDALTDKPARELARGITGTEQNG